MAWKSKKEYVPNFEVVENCGIIEEKEDSNWGVALARVSWAGKPPAYDIRDFNLSTIDLEKEKVRMGKGVTLWDDESMDRLAHLLIEMGFGDPDTIEDLIEERSSFYTLNDKPKKNKKRKVKAIRL